MNQVGLGDASFWDLKYQDETKRHIEFITFDLYCPFESVYSILQSLVDMRKAHRILLIGIGRSKAIEVLYKKGFHSITAIDISPTIVHKLQNHYRDYNGVEFYVMDVKELSSFKDKSFSLVIDKGCIDALFCGIDFIESTERALNEIFRVLEDQGSFVSVSYASYASREPYFRRNLWRIENCPLTDGEGLTMYNLVKDPGMLEEGPTPPHLQKKKETPSPSLSTLSSSQERRKTGASRSVMGNDSALSINESDEAIADLVAQTAELDG